MIYQGWDRDWDFRSMGHGGMDGSLFVAHDSHAEQALLSGLVLLDVWKSNKQTIQFNITLT
jgi:hypothetical protein